MMDSELQQYERNNQLSFALASMAFEEYTHIVVLHRVPGQGLQLLGGGSCSSVLRRFGDLKVLRSCITPHGLLRIVVESPPQGHGS